MQLNHIPKGFIIGWHFSNHKLVCFYRSYFYLPPAASKFTEQKISAMKKRTRSKVQNLLSFNKSEKSEKSYHKSEKYTSSEKNFSYKSKKSLKQHEKSIKIAQTSASNKKSSIWQFHHHKHKPTDENSSSGRGSDFSPSPSSDRAYFQDENVELEVYPDGLARIVDPRITELDFWRDAVLAD